MASHHASVKQFVLHLLCLAVKIERWEPAKWAYGTVQCKIFADRLRHDGDQRLYLALHSRHFHHLSNFPSSAKFGQTAPDTRPSLVHCFILTDPLLWHWLSFVQFGHGRIDDASTFPHLL
jgi:hypothetical protein